MEPLALISLTVLLVGAYWSLEDQMKKAGLEPARLIFRYILLILKRLQLLFQICSDLRSRDISSSTACRAGLSR